MSSPGSKRPLSSTERAISPPAKKKVKVEASVTSQTVANFFKPASQKPTPTQPKKKVSWRIVNNSCIVGHYLVGQKGETQKEEQGNEIKIAAFDLDHTLIMPKSNARFSRSASDWKWWDASVPSKLKQLAADGYTLVIVSNQKAVSLKTDGKAKTGNSDSKSLSILKEKITTVLDTLDLDVPVSIYAATQYDEYRKPRMGMWREMVKDLGLDMSDDVDEKEASRPVQTLDLESSIFVGDAAGRKGDHSCCDRQKCLKVANENLLVGKSVAVDNTNANKATRAEWISLAKSLNLPIRCIYLSTPISVCKHNDAVRAANLTQFLLPPLGHESLNPESRTKLPGMAFSEYARRFEEPDISEGFKDVASVVFQFDGDKEAREIWGQYWI
ncbi:polynucleotide kinase [Trichophyton equinum CBS 127.97]|uniref:Polynucleotide kinase n=1 Tax=Trichophyton equinum (strain ATCC MYA-4606 / CBS 127.97) TaxID=559882 RepID=F2PMF5_TRIEC|nr:polynucleotide kinase [Trichophyton equinum CBS 127.97]